MLKSRFRVDSSVSESSSPPISWRSPASQRTPTRESVQALAKEVQARLRSIRSTAVASALANVADASLRKARRKRSESSDKNSLQAVTPSSSRSTLNDAMLVPEEGVVLVLQPSPRERGCSRLKLFERLQEDGRERFTSFWLVVLITATAAFTCLCNLAELLEPLRNFLNAR